MSDPFDSRTLISFSFKMEKDVVDRYKYGLWCQSTDTCSGTGLRVYLVKRRKVSMHAKSTPKE